MSAAAVAVLPSAASPLALASAPLPLNPPMSISPPPHVSSYHGYVRGHSYRHRHHHSSSSSCNSSQLQVSSPSHAHARAHSPSIELGRVRVRVRAPHHLTVSVPLSSVHDGDVSPPPPLRWSDGSEFASTSTSPISERPRFYCDVCAHAFRTKHNLDQHLAGAAHKRRLMSLGLPIPKTVARTHRLLSIDEKKHIVRKFYAADRERCACGGFTLGDMPSPPNPAAAPAATPTSGELHSPVAGSGGGGTDDHGAVADPKQPPPKASKKKSHTPAQLSSILSNVHNKEWVCHCVECNRLYCRACRQFMTLDTCLNMVRYGYSWVTGIADGTKWDKLVSSAPDPHNNSREHAACLKMMRAAAVKGSRDSSSSASSASTSSSSLLHSGDTVVLTPSSSADSSAAATSSSKSMATSRPSFSAPTPIDITGGTPSSGSSPACSPMNATASPRGVVDAPATSTSAAAAAGSKSKPVSLTAEPAGGSTLASLLATTIGDTGDSSASQSSAVSSSSPSVTPTSKAHGTSMWSPSGSRKRARAFAPQSASKANPPRRYPPPTITKESTMTPATGQPVTVTGNGSFFPIVTKLDSTAISPSSPTARVGRVVNGRIHCPSCGMEFNRRREVIRHFGVHVQPRVFRCVPCDLRFASGHQLRRHARQIHENKVDDAGIRRAQDAIERLFHLADKASKKSKLEAYHQQRKRDEEVSIVTSDEIANISQPPQKLSKSSRDARRRSPSPQIAYNGGGGSGSGGSASSRRPSIDAHRRGGAPPPSHPYAVLDAHRRHRNPAALSYSASHHAHARRPSLVFLASASSYPVPTPHMPTYPIPHSRSAPHLGASLSERLYKNPISPPDAFPRSQSHASLAPRTPYLDLYSPLTHERKRTFSVSGLSGQMEKHMPQFPMAHDFQEPNKRMKLSMKAVDRGEMPALERPTKEGFSPVRRDESVDLEGDERKDAVTTADRTASRMEDGVSGPTNKEHPGRPEASVNLSSHKGVNASSSSECNSKKRKRDNGGHGNEDNDPLEHEKDKHDSGGVKDATTAIDDVVNLDEDVGDDREGHRPSSSASHSEDATSACGVADRSTGSGTGSERGAGSERRRATLLDYGCRRAKGRVDTLVHAELLVGAVKPKMDIEASTFEMRAGEFVNLIELAMSDHMWCEYPAAAAAAAVGAATAVTVVATERRGVKSPRLGRTDTEQRNPTPSNSTCNSRLALHSAKVAKGGARATFFCTRSECRRMYNFGSIDETSHRLTPS